MPTKLTLPLQSSGKMEVTPQQSEILQNELFKMGYAWAEASQEVKHTKFPYITWYNEKGISFGRFAFDKEALTLFDNHFKIEE